MTVTDPFLDLAESWVRRSERYVAQAKRLDEAEKPLEALRLGTYALQWSLAAKELNDLLREFHRAELPEHIRQAISKPKLRSVT